MPQDMSREPAMDPAARGTGLGGLVGLAALMTETRWCVWVWSSRRGSSWTKVPIIAGSHHNLRADDPTCARSYAACRGGVIRGEAAGVGWMCVGDLERVWFDLDKCRDPVTGELAPWARAFLARAGAAYWEVTPSGTGIRVMGRVAGFSEPRQGRLMMREFLGGLDAERLAVWGGSTECEARAAIEVFLGCVRYVTMSGWMAAGDGEVDVTDLTRDVLDAEDAQDVIRAPRVRALARGQEAKSGEALTGPVEDIVGAFGVIPNAEWDENASWDEWSLLGMATWNATNGSPEGFEAWCGWSAKSELHIEENCLERWDRWRVSRVDAVGIGLIMMRAARWSGGSFRRPTRRPAAEFQVEVEEGEADAAGGGGGDGGGGSGGAGGAFDALAARLIYVRRHHRYLDRATRHLILMIDEPRLKMLAARLGVAGAWGQGAKSVAARLAREGSGMRVAVDLTMVPGGGEIIEGPGGPLANTWRPTTLVPAIGGDAGMWVRHAEALIADEADRARVFDRMAWALQHPGRKINSALVLFGGQLTGKDTFLQPFWMALGPHNVAIVQGQRMNLGFNSFLEKSWLLISEMPPAHKRDVYEDIKGILTTPPDHIRINRKGLEEYDIPNLVNLMITTNHEGAIALADDDRRFDVVLTRQAAADEDAAAYYGALHHWYETGGHEAVFGWLMARDVSAFNPHARPPMTLAKATMAREGANPIVSWVMSLWEDGGTLARRDHLTFDEVLTAARMDGGSTIHPVFAGGHVLRALRLSGFRRVDVKFMDGGKLTRMWTRTRFEMLSGAPAGVLAAQLVQDRERASRAAGTVGAEF